MGTRQHALTGAQRMYHSMAGSWNLLMRVSSVMACAESSSLVADACSAVAELDCTTSDIWLTPCSVCFIASACSFAVSLIFLDALAMSSIPSTTRSMDALTISAVLLPSEMALNEVSIRVLVSAAECALCSASWRIWSATTAKPLPASPALAASMEAFRESRFVCDAISSISEMMLPTCCDASLMRRSRLATSLPSFPCGCALPRQHRCVPGCRIRLPGLLWRGYRRILS